jgi:hypothetical protein
VEGAFEHYVHPKKGSPNMWKLWDQEVSQAQLKGFIQELWEQFPNTRSPVSTQLSESLNSVKAKVADKNYSFNSSFVARCAVTVLKWNEGESWVPELRDELGFEPLPQGIREQLVARAKTRDDARVRSRTEDARKARYVTRRKTEAKREKDAREGGAEPEHEKPTGTIPAHPPSPAVRSLARANETRDFLSDFESNCNAMIDINQIRFGCSNDRGVDCHFLALLEVFCALRPVRALLTEKAEGLPVCPIADQLRRPEIIGPRLRAVAAQYIASLQGALCGAPGSLFGAGDASYFSVCRNGPETLARLVGTLRAGGECCRAISELFRAGWRSAWASQSGCSETGRRNTSGPAQGCIALDVHYASLAQAVGVGERSSPCSSWYCHSCKQVHGFAQQLSFETVPALLVVNVLQCERDARVFLPARMFIMDSAERTFTCDLVAYTRTAEHHCVAVVRYAGKWHVYDDSGLYSGPAAHKRISLSFRDGYVQDRVETAFYATFPR